MNRSLVYRNLATVTVGSRYKKCFLCDTRVQNSQIRNVHQLFYEKACNENEEDQKSLATILSDVLDKSIIESKVHSKIVCRKCAEIVNEYERTSKILADLRQNIKLSFDQTVNKYSSKPFEMKMNSHAIDFEHIGETDREYIPHMYENEHDIGENVFDNHTRSDDGSDAIKQTGGRPKKLTMIKRESTINPFFSISSIEENDNSEPEGIHQVLIDEMTESSQFGDTVTVDANDSIIDEQSQNSGVQYIVADDDAKEYFESNDDHLIEVNTNDDLITSKVNYQYVFEDDSSDVLHDVTEADDDINFSDSQRLNSECQKGSPSSNFTIKRTTKNKENQDHKEVFLREGMKFRCLLCPSQTDVVYDTKSISIHLKTDHNERVYVCSICGIDFRKRNPYNEHMDEHLSSDGAYECEICKSAFNDARLFRMHKKTHNSSLKIWPCKMCGKKYSSKNLLDEHMNMHTGERPYKCPHCVKDFASKYTLTAHMKIHYDRKRPFECKDCGKSFFSNQNLTQHVRTHTGVKEYECDICSKKFGTPHNLDVHKIVHTGHKPFICRTCGKAFARRAEIKDHERTHTGERPYKCDMCPSSFAQRSNLMSHKRATHFNDKRYKCETCHRSFKRRRLLEYHIKATHTGERPYKCDICNSTFVYPEHYKKHIRIHSGVKPFTCEVCGKAFNSRDNRNAHRYVHSDKKPYECLVCNQGFMRKPLLYAHMEAQKHLNDKIIVNQPRIPIKKDNNNGEQNGDTNQIHDENDGNDIVYLNINDEDFMDDDEYTALEVEHIVDDGEITNEEHLMIENQFDDVIETTTHLAKGNFVRKFTTKQHDPGSGPDDDLTGDNETVTFIETAEGGDSFNTEICVPIDGDNVSWIDLSS